MKCRVCNSISSYPLWLDRDGCAWRRCNACGSDSSDAQYSPASYGRDYVIDLLFEENGAAVANSEHNVQLFEKHVGACRGTFLDVGCGHGASMAAMFAAGWDVTGFDLDRSGRPAGVVVGQEFRADLFATRFDCVLSREVLEHVPDPHGLLKELHAVTKLGGICQITTPRPMTTGEAYCCYQRFHLSLWSPARLVAELKNLGFEIVESDIWEFGQRHVCRRQYV